MKRFSALLLPFTLILALVGLTFWLQRITDLPEVRHTSQARHDPDTIVEHFTVRRLDEQGRLKYLLKGERMVHYGDDESSDMDRPHLTWFRPDAPTVTLAASRGHGNRDGSRIDLSGGVTTTRAATGDRPTLTVRTETLRVLPEQQQAHTDDLVRMMEGPSWLTGTGMDLDSKAQTYVLRSGIRAMRVNPPYPDSLPPATPPVVTTPVTPAPATATLPASPPAVVSAD